jgi:succinate dehydrogenase/fumarate reductase cytochrome b subunit
MAMRKMVQEVGDGLLFTGIYFWTGYAFGSLIDAIHMPALEEGEDDARVYSENWLVLNLLVQTTLISLVYMYGLHALKGLRNPLWRLVGPPPTGDPAFHTLQGGLFFSLGLGWASVVAQRYVGALTIRL